MKAMYACGQNWEIFEHLLRAQSIKYSPDLLEPLGCLQRRELSSCVNEESGTGEAGCLFQALLVITWLPCNLNSGPSDSKALILPPTIVSELYQELSQGGGNVGDFFLIHFLLILLTENSINPSIELSFANLGFFNLSTAAVWGQVILCAGCCLCCGGLSSSARDQADYGLQLQCLSRVSALFCILTSPQPSPQSSPRISHFQKNPHLTPSVRRPT